MRVKGWYLLINKEVVILSEAKDLVPRAYL
jgi:hypothetical protein